MIDFVKWWLGWDAFPSWAFVALVLLAAALVFGFIRVGLRILVPCAVVLVALMIAGFVPW